MSLQKSAAIWSFAGGEFRGIGCLFWSCFLIRLSGIADTSTRVEWYHASGKDASCATMELEPSSGMLWRRQRLPPIVPDFWRWGILLLSNYVILLFDTKAFGEWLSRFRSIRSHGSREWNFDTLIEEKSSGGRRSTSRISKLLCISDGKKPAMKFRISSLRLKSQLPNRDSLLPGENSSTHRGSLLPSFPVP